MNNRDIAKTCVNVDLTLPNGRKELLERVVAALDSKDSALLESRKLPSEEDRSIASPISREINMITVEHEVDIYSKGSVNKGLTHIELSEAKVLVPIEIDLGKTNKEGLIELSKAQIHFKFTGEGLIIDVLDPEGTVIATSSQMYDELVDDLLRKEHLESWDPAYDDFEDTDDGDGFCGCDECLGLIDPDKGIN